MGAELLYIFGIPLFIICPILMCIFDNFLDRNKNKTKAEIFQDQDRKRRQREQKRGKLLTENEANKLEVEKKRELEEYENAKEYFCKICERIHTKKSNIGKGHYNRESN